MTGSAAAGKVLLLAAIAAVVILFFALDLDRWITFDALKHNRDALLRYTHEHYTLAVLAYIAAYCLQTALSLPGALIFTLAGGFLFGAVPGTLYVNLAATSGATLAFLAARYLLRDTVERRFGTRLRAIQDGVGHDAFNYLLTLRLLPVVPFFLVNLAAGLTHIPLRTYVAATAIGIIPASFAYAYAGRRLGAIESAHDLVSPGVLASLALLGLLALAPVLYRRVTKRPPAAA